MKSERDILGLWIDPTVGATAKFWLSVMSELHNRVVNDVLLLCCDGLKGLPEAAKVTWNLIDVQLCVVHLVRNSLRFASKKHWGKITSQLREIYTAPSIGSAEMSFDAFASEWGALYRSDDQIMVEHLGRLRTVPAVPSSSFAKSCTPRMRLTSVRRGFLWLPKGNSNLIGAHRVLD